MSNTRTTALAAAVAILLAAGGTAQATVVSEDFSYSSGQLQNMSGGGTGWFDGTLGWGASTGGGATTSKVLVDAATNLTTTVGGYNITQTGTGLAYGRYNAFRGSNRYIDTDLSGTVWFSALLRNPVSTDRAGIQFNNHADAPYGGADYNRGNFDVGIYGQDLRVTYNGGLPGPSAATVPVGQTHLVVGKMVIGAGNDSLEVWADPADLQSLGAPDFSQADANIGDDLYLAGVFGYHQRGGGDSDSGQIDALRISDGGGDAAQAFLDVVGPLAPPPPPSVVQPLDVKADANVVGWSTNGGEDGTQLLVKRNYDTTFNRKTYMRFDLNDLVGHDLAGLVDATLKLNFVASGKGANPGQDWEFGVYGLDDGDAGEGWGEATIKWDDAPGNSDSGYLMGGNATSLGTFNLTGDTGLVEFSSADLLNFIQGHTVSDLTTLMIVRNTPGTGGSGGATYVHAIASKENGLLPGPQLVLTGPSPAGVIPEPATMCAIALAVAGLGGYVKKRRRF